MRILLIVLLFTTTYLFSQESVFDFSYDYYPQINTDTIPLADSLHTKTFHNMDTYRQLIFIYINEERRLAGLKPLVIDSKIQILAQTHSDYMARWAKYKHSGLNYDEVITHLAGILILSHKQNAGCAVGQWMGSPPHREALLGPNFTKMGIGVCENGSGYVMENPPGYPDYNEKFFVTNNTYFTVIFDY